MNPQIWKMEENLFMADSNDFDQYIQDLLSGKTPPETAITKICAKVISTSSSSSPKRPKKSLLKNQMSSH